MAGEAWERLYQFGDSFIETINYDASNRILRGISCLHHESGRPSHTIGFSLKGHPNQFKGTPEAIWRQGLERNLNIAVHREDYTYIGESLIRISTKHWEHGWHHSEPERLVEGEYQLDYLPGGELDRVTWRLYSIDRSWVVYRRLQPGETLKSLTEDVKSKLIEAIPKMVQQANFVEPLYCVQLHCLDGHFFPPRIIPGLESHRSDI